MVGKINDYTCPYSPNFPANHLKVPDAEHVINHRPLVIARLRSEWRSGVSFPRAFPCQLFVLLSQLLVAKRDAVPADQLLISTAVGMKYLVFDQFSLFGSSVTPQLLVACRTPVRVALEEFVFIQLKNQFGFCRLDEFLGIWEPPLNLREHE